MATFRSDTNPCLMNHLFPLPLYSFAKTAAQNGGVALGGIRNVVPWMIKTVLLEPLRWAELMKNERVREHSIPQDPIFILGFYRSGTSFLHECLTQDDRLGYHTNYQMIFPEHMLSSERFLAPAFDGVCRLLNLQDPVHRIQMSFKFPGEEDATMTTALSPHGAQWGYFFPSMMMEQFRKYVLFEGISPEDLEAWKEDFLFLLKKISLASDGRQLVLKSPPNTARIELLLSMFPNAKFIMIHRNPYEVYSSNKRFWTVTKRIYAVGSFKGVDVNEVILDTYSAIMQRYLDQKNLVPEGQLYEIPYQDFIQRPLDSLRDIYGQLNLGDFDYCESTMRSYLGPQKGYVRMQYELPEKEKEAVTRKLEPFLRHWRYGLQ